MSYNPIGLSAISYANGFTLWHYRTADASVEAQGYFDPAHKMLRVGDFIMLRLAIDSDNPYGMVAVTANADGIVSISPMVVVGARR